MIEKTIRFILSLFLFLFPLFFLPITTDPYDFNKLALVCLTLAVVFGIFAVSKPGITHPFRMGPFGIPLLGLSLVSVASLLLQSPNIIQSLITPLSTSSLIAVTLLYFVLINTAAIHSATVTVLLVISGTVLAIAALLASVSLFGSPAFTPAGSIFPSLIFCIPVLFLTGGLLWQHLWRKNHPKGIGTTKTGVLVLCGLLQATACIALFVQVTGTQKPVTLPLLIGTKILTSTFKDPQTLLLGVGPANFITAFTMGKPADYNSTTVWNIVFSSSSSFLLTLGSETGILSVFLFCMLLVIALVRSFTPGRRVPAIALTVLLLLLIVFPANMATLILLATLCAIATPKISSSKGKRYPLPILILVKSVLGLTALLMLYGLGRTYAAEFLYSRSLSFLTANKGTETYNLQRQTLTFNPYIDRYHLGFSRTSLAIANTLASRESLNDSDKQTIPKLVQQALEEGRVAVSLSPTNPLTWDYLAGTYASLLQFAEGADQWAIDSYKKKLLLDPLDPTTHMGIGGVYLSLSRFPDAESSFREAVRLKPDFANAHFNLALALKAQGKQQESKASFEQASRFVPAGSEDFTKIQAESDAVDRPVPPQDASSIPTDGESSPAAALQDRGNPAINPTIAP